MRRSVSFLAIVVLPMGCGSSAAEQILPEQTASPAASDAVVSASSRWIVSDVIRPIHGGESIAADFGQFVRVDLQNLGSNDVFSVVLPEVRAEHVGRRVGVAEVWGAMNGPAWPELHILTSAGQEIDFNIPAPFELVGVRPRAVFVAAKTSPNTDVYGWSIESATATFPPP